MKTLGAMSGWLPMRKLNSPNSAPCFSRFCCLKKALTVKTMNEAGRMECYFERRTILKKSWESSARRNSTRKSFSEKQTAKKKSDEKRRAAPSKKTILFLLKNKMGFDQKKREFFLKDKFSSAKSGSRFLRMKESFRRKIESCPVRIRVWFWSKSLRRQTNLNLYPVCWERSLSRAGTLSLSAAEKTLYLGMS
jgi:hypothetical protein